MVTSTLNRRLAERDMIDHPELGRVYVTVKPVARRLIARWKNDCVHLTAPEGLRVTDVIASLDRMAPRLLPRRPSVSYNDGMVFDFEGISMTIGRQRVKPSKVIISGHAPETSVLVGTDLDFGDRSTTMLISNAMTAIARREAAGLLIPRARELAVAVEHQPAGWRISSGRHILGQCNALGIINLSYMNVFLPADLRDYIILHELAHLSEMNHSVRFHQLCDRYCGGHEREMIARLRNFSWPVLR